MNKELINEATNSKIKTAEQVEAEVVTQLEDSPKFQELQLQYQEGKKQLTVFQTELLKIREENNSLNKEIVKAYAENLKLAKMANKFLTQQYTQNSYQAPMPEGQDVDVTNEIDPIIEAMLREKNKK